MAHEESRSSFFIIINLSRCSLWMILLQLSLDFATIRVYYIIRFMFKNGWYSTRLKVSPLRCVSHNRLQNSWHESNHYKQLCLLNKNFQLYILFQCYGAILLLALCLFFLGQENENMKHFELLFKTFSITFVAAAIGLTTWHLVIIF